MCKEGIKNNQLLVDELNKAMKSSIKVVNVPGKHDMTLKKEILSEAIPGNVQVSGDVQGLGTYIIGERREIAIEHCHRYDVFSAPYRRTNEKLCGKTNIILPAGYLFAVNAASWVIEGKPVK